MSKLLLALALILALAGPARAAVVFNEFYASPPSGEPEWLELYNDSEVAVDLTGWQIAESVSGQVKNFEPVVKAGEATLSAQAFLTVIPSKLTLNNGGDTIYLFAPDDTLADVVTYPKLTTAQAYARMPDGGEGWEIATPTPGQSNVAVSEPAATDSSDADTTGSTLPVVATDNAANAVASPSTTTKTTTTTSGTTTKTTTTTNNSNNSSSTATTTSPQPVAGEAESTSWQEGIEFRAPRLAYAYPTPTPIPRVLGAATTAVVAASSSAGAAAPALPTTPNLPLLALAFAGIIGAGVVLAALTGLARTPQGSDELEVF